MQTYFEGDQVSLFDQDTSAGKTSWAYSAQARRTGRISGLSWSQLLDYIAPPYQFLDLTPGAGNLLGQFEWEIRSALHGGALLRNTGPSPRDATESCLSQILEDHPPKKYYLTTAACLGILRRAKERGKPLPKALDTALRIQAGLIGLPEGREKTVPFDDSAVLAQPGMKQQTFAASFSAGASATAGTIGYAEEVAPTLKGSPSGNCMPSVMCLHDQGGQRMEVCENMTGTLRAGEKGHQPLVYENHGVDARIRESSEISPTVTARFGTGGGNTPLVQEPNEVYCIVGNIIDRQPENGGNGCGYQENLAYIITTCDRHAVYARQRVDEFRNDDIASTQSARQAKDATDLVVEPDRQYAQFIRRLTPWECELLQGFPPGWTDIPSASDSARYRALGNSVPVPCVEFIMKSLREVTELETERSQVQ
ncbi:MAG: DNA cytosine methyltransferase [Oscillospiraceae bacterium]